MRASVLILLGTLLFAGCDAGGDTPADGAVPDAGLPCDHPSATLGGANGLQVCVFTPSCSFSTCHGAATPQLGLSLADEAATCAGLVDRAAEQAPALLRVAAGDPDASYLMDKLAGAGVTGEPMPPPSGGLAPGRLEAIRAWIAAGAPCD